jgi:hypothetical protein
MMGFERLLTWQDRLHHTLSTNFTNGPGQGSRAEIGATLLVVLVSHGFLERVFQHAATRP